MKAIWVEILLGKVVLNVDGKAAILTTEQANELARALQDAEKGCKEFPLSGELVACIEYNKDGWA